MNWQLISRIRLLGLAVFCCTGLCQTTSAQTISGTLDDGVPAGTRKLRGDVITNIVTVTNASGASANNVTLNLATPANATDGPGAVHASPIAFDDSYTAIGNTKLYVGVTPPAGEPAKSDVGPTLLENDTIATDTISLAGFTSGTTQGGSVTVNANGTFVYTPPVNFTGTDTFTYAPANSTDATLTGSGTVTISVSSKVWYVNNAGSNGDGRSATPFNSLANAQTASSTGDVIYVFTGSGSYTTGITLKNSQFLVGQGIALVVGGNTLLGAGSRPTIATSTGVALTLANGNTVAGLNVSPSAGGAISGSSVGSLTLSNMIVSTTSGRAVSITNGTVNVVLDNVSSTSSSDHGISLSTIGGTFTANGGTLQNSTGANLFISGGAADVTYTGTIVDNAGRSVDIQSKSGGSVTLSGNINQTAGTGINVVNNTGTTVNFSGTSKVINTGVNTAITLSGNNSASAINFNNGGLDVDTTSGTAFSVTGAGTVNVSGTGNTINATTGTAFLNSGSGGSAIIDINAPIVNTTGRLLDIQSRTSGAVILSGGLTNSGTGILLQNNSGSTINLSGTINLNTSANAAFTATGGGTVNVTASNNTIVTTTGTAVNVANTTIGASGITFRSISVSGAGNGIILDTTGSGSFSVTGNSSGNCGGKVIGTTPGSAPTIIAHDAADATGGTIQNTTGDGIRLNNVQNVSLTRMQILNSAQSGIFGTRVNGFQLISCYISNNGNNVDEQGLRFTDVTNPGSFDGLTGTATNGSNPTRIINSTVRQSGEFNVEIVNRTGTLTDLFVDGCQFTDTKLNAGPTDADGFNVEMQSTSVATVRLANCYFANNFTQGAQLSAIDTATLNATVTSSTFTNNNEGLVCNHSQSSDLNATIGGDSLSQGNTFYGEPSDTDTGALIVLSTSSTGTAAASLTGKIKNNYTVAPANMVNHSIIAFVSGASTPAQLNISSNTVVHQAFGHCILVDTPDLNASPQFGVIANGNNVTNTASGGHGVLVQARQSSTACVLIQNNHGTVAVGSSVARARASSVSPQVATLNLKQGVSSSMIASTVIADNNPGVPTTTTGTTLNVVNNGACTTPTP